MGAFFLILQYTHFHAAVFFFFCYDKSYEFNVLKNLKKFFKNPKIFNVKSSLNSKNKLKNNIFVVND